MTLLNILMWCRSHDGRILAVSSTDGYCTLVTFEENELGIPYEKQVVKIQTAAESAEKFKERQRLKEKKKKKQENNNNNTMEAKEASAADRTERQHFEQIAKKPVSCRAPLQSRNK